MKFQQKIIKKLILGQSKSVFYEVKIECKNKKTHSLQNEFFQSYLYFIEIKSYKLLVFIPLFFKISIQITNHSTLLFKCIS